jgi:hypothetical protein
MLYLQAGEVGLVVMAQTMSVKAIVLLKMKHMVKM